MKANCAFQYYKTGFDGGLVEDVYSITLDEAKALWNKHYQSMIERARNNQGFEVVIWIEMENDCDYSKKLIHLKDPDYKNGVLVETITTRFPKFDQ